MLRRQEPDSDLVAGNLIGQQLANRSLKAGRVARLSALFASGPLGLDLLGHAFRTTGVEFFFANQSRFALQSQGALSFKLFQQLKIALFSVTEFTSSLSGAQSLTLAFEKHGQLVGNLIIVQEDRTGMADEFCGRIEELEHGAKLGIKGTKSQIIYGGI